MTTTTINLDALTVRESMLTLTDVMQSMLTLTDVMHRLFDNDESIILSEDIRTVAYTIENNLQVRDYLMGLPSELTLGECFNIVTAIRDMANQLGENTMALNTVLSAYHLMNSDNKSALALLEQGLESNYPLATLLNRVISAGWPADSFLTMARELHPKVLDAIAESASDLVNESLRESVGA